MKLHSRHFSSNEMNADDHINTVFSLFHRRGVGITRLWVHKNFQPRRKKGLIKWKGNVLIVNNKTFSTFFLQIAYWLENRRHLIVFNVFLSFSTRSSFIFLCRVNARYRMRGKKLESSEIYITLCRDGNIFYDLSGKKCVQSIVKII